MTNNPLSLFDDQEDAKRDEQQTSQSQHLLQQAKQQAQNKKPAGFQPLSSILQRFSLDDKGGHITREFQDYGYRLAVELDDLSHKSLYIRLAKTVDRKILEDARTFVLDANANSRARLFMWKLKQLRAQHKANKEKKSKTTE